MNQAARPPHDLLLRQSQWLAPARSRALRLAQIARRRRVLDLGCGPGAVTQELARRCGGTVLALDADCSSLAKIRPCPGVIRLCGDARRLPLANACCDLVFSQFALLWMDLSAALAEIHRVLEPDGALVALEPDHAGLIEHPPEAATGDLWIAALARAGGNPRAGRELAAQVQSPFWEPEVLLLDRLVPPSPDRLDFLRTLPLTADEQSRLAAAAGVSCHIAHLPVFIVIARKR